MVVKDKNIITYQNEMKRIGKEFSESVMKYKNFIEDSLYDVPIQVLCLPENINNILIKNNILRVVELRRIDLGSIKGLGSKKIGVIQFRLSQFIFV